jgi:hypothetical protein
MIENGKTIRNGNKRQETKGMVMGDDWHWEASEGMVKNMVGMAGDVENKKSKIRGWKETTSGNDQGAMNDIRGQWEGH